PRLARLGAAALHAHAALPHAAAVAAVPRDERGVGAVDVSVVVAAAHQAGVGEPEVVDVAVDRAATVVVPARVGDLLVPGKRHVVPRVALSAGAGAGIP